MEELYSGKPNINQTYPFTNILNASKIPLMFSNAHKKKISKRFDRSLSTLHLSTYNHSTLLPENQPNFRQINRENRTGQERRKKTGSQISSCRRREGKQELSFNVNSVPKKSNFLRKLKSEERKLGSYGWMNTTSNEKRERNFCLNQNENIRITDFQLGLGNGEDNEGKTYPARHKKTGFLCTIKQVNKYEIKSQIQQFIRNLKFQMFFKHKNILQVYAVFDDPVHVYLVKEYIEEGVLFSKLKLHKGIKYNKVQPYFRDIALALQSIHKFNCILQNLKPQNIGIIHDVCKLSNLTSISLSRQEKKFNGAIQYAPPQIFLGSPYSYESDVWGLGILMYELLTGINPFHNKSKKEAVNKIITSTIDLRLLKDMPKRMIELLCRMLCTNSKDRIKIDEILSIVENWNAD